MVKKSVKSSGKKSNVQRGKKEGERSDIKKYIEYVDEESEEQKNILKMVQPLPNKNGIMTVEVDKIVRDLRTLQ